jgi:hypothetical protein
MVSIAKSSEGKMKGNRFYIGPKEYSLTHDKTPNNRRECLFCMIPREGIMPYLSKKVSIFNFTPP